MYVYNSDCHQNAEKIAKAVTFQYGESSSTPILDVKDAVQKNAFYPEPKVNIISGDAKGTSDSLYVTLPYK